ncbi:unnamed protein product [Peronospora belbahrii]|nr:unnamed protein product [Peronospora belbahrii]
MQYDSIKALDETLLAELDDMLSFEKDSLNELHMMLTFDIPSLLDENIMTDIAVKPLTMNRCSSGKMRPIMKSSVKGKDVRSAPYSKPNKSCRRIRPKDELSYLRAKVADMEEKLQSLQTTAYIGSTVQPEVPWTRSAGESGCSQDALN